MIWWLSPFIDYVIYILGNQVAAAYAQVAAAYAQVAAAYTQAAAAYAQAAASYACCASRAKLKLGWAWQYDNFS